MQLLDYLKKYNITQICCSDYLNLPSNINRDDYKYKNAKLPTLFYGLCTQMDILNLNRHIGKKFILWTKTCINYDKIKVVSYSRNKNSIVHLVTDEEVRSVLQKFRIYSVNLLTDMYADDTYGENNLSQLIKVSVILPTLNRFEGFKNVIDQILSQTYKNIELIIVDDGSDNDILNQKENFINNLNDNRIKFFKNDTNRKIPYTINKGIRNCTGDYITWISDDNNYYNIFIEKLLDTDYDFIYSDFEFFTQNSNNKKIINIKFKNLNNVISKFNGLASFMYSKKLVNNIGLFDENLFQAEDYEYLLRIYNNISKIKYVPETTMSYLRHSESLYSKNKIYIRNMTSNISSIYKIIQDYKDKPVMLYYSKVSWTKLLEKSNQIIKFMDLNDFKIIITSDDIVKHDKNNNLLIINYKYKNIIFNNLNKLTIYYSNLKLLDEIKVYEKIYEKLIFINSKLNVFIINLDDQKEKLSQSINQFSTNIFNVNRFNAIKGIDIRNLNEDLYVIDMDISKYSNGQIGCLMSHLSLIKRFYEELDDEYILIVEDDIKDLNLHNFNIFQIIDKAPKNWHTIRLSYMSDSKVLNKLLDENKVYNNNHNLWLMGTCSYLISKDGCKYIYENFFKNNKWEISNLIKNLEKETLDDRFPIDKWLYANTNNYCLKYIYYGYFKSDTSQVSSNKKELDYQNLALTNLIENNKKINLFNPDVSIILPTYNGLKKLPEAIDSILNQTYKNFELIIIIDGSTDGTYEYLTNKYSNNENIHIVYQKNMKLPCALNEGLKRCRGKFITWTSDDNQLRENMIMKLRDFLIKNTEIKFVYSGVNFYGNSTWEFKSKQSNIDLFFNYPGLASFMWTKEAINNIGFYDASLNGIEDYDYILRTIEMYPNVGYVDEILFDYYFDVSGTNMTSEIMKYNKLKQLNFMLLDNLFSRHNNNLPNFNILYPNSNLSYEEKCDQLHNIIITCQKDGYLEYFQKTNILTSLKKYKF